MPKGKKSKMSKILKRQWKSMTLRRFHNRYGPDDWICPKIGCKNINFAWRNECQRCNTSKFQDNSRIPSSESPGLVNVPRIPLHIEDEEETIELEDDVQNNAIMNQKPIIPSNSNHIHFNFLQKDVKTMIYTDLEAEKRREENEDEEFVIEKILGKKIFQLNTSYTICNFSND